MTAKRFNLWIAICIGMMILAFSQTVEASRPIAILHTLQNIEDPDAVEQEEDFVGLTTTFFSLPEGESTLIRFPTGKTMLVDTGSERDTEKLVSLLLERHITKVDYLLLTNDLPTHIGGYEKLAEKIQFDKIYMSKLTALAIHSNIHISREKQVVYVNEKDQLLEGKDVVITFLHPSENLFLSPQDNSLVFCLTQGELQFLFTSAINEKAEERLLSKYPSLLPAEIVKVAAQGSNQATTQPFLTRVDPQVAVVQTGISRGQWKDSMREVLERLEESWADTYVTSRDGSITILSNGQDYKVLKAVKTSTRDR
ncbi:MBL fold metallo-hydrolase [Brevibacillus laterosporus]|uniref:MBL fold metallo-hydrolase n=1 Tax=Brevibacillus laterosporus TaxID=1465 RepID=A0A502H220_BRELA|nr:MBL fold metallo-hydrolase [Brevibacillus laterosporus]QDX93855.1 MBL fold metallo-hydrolase [Brevibacillus laterosporus]TPG67805.1 MBL fold metallo-hydrolase [Brevibacillus laterosporus]TPG89504.1 MBL fold metallo-hydrolase [Brevibacillus laterosporus]